MEKTVIIKYDHIWIIRMCDKGFAEKNYNQFIEYCKEADNYHLNYLLKKLEFLEEYLACHLVYRILRNRKLIFNRRKKIINKKWNTSFTTAKI